MNSTTASRPRQELAHRTGAGIEVTLFWSEDEDDLTVRVVDHFSDECFEMPISRELGGYAFRHPFAYAAEHGLDHDSLIQPAA